MDGPTPAGIYLLTCLLYLIPIFLLAAAWADCRRNTGEQGQPSARQIILKIALPVAVCGTVFSLVFIFSYFNHAAIHGGKPSPGIWRIAGPISIALEFVTLVLVGLGKGKGRLKLLGWALALFGAAFVSAYMDFD